MASKARGGQGGGNHPISNSTTSHSTSSSQQQPPKVAPIAARARGGGGGGGGGRSTERRDLPLNNAAHEKASSNDGQLSIGDNTRRQQAAAPFKASQQSQPSTIIDGLISAKLADADLIFLPFFPEDNGAEPAAIINTAEVLKIAERGLDELLSMNLHR